MNFQGEIRLNYFVWDNNSSTLLIYLFFDYLYFDIALYIPICANPPNRHSFCVMKLAKIFFGAHLSDKLFSIFIEYIMRNNSWTSQSGFVTTFFSTFSIKSDFVQLQEKCWKITLFQVPAILTGRIIQKF